eukprot:augustus_masked-scaffold_6-processed-gene-12.38-mRNA-1 protein AED:0.22 eAED:0.24 QI:0/-1/0/1/-1/1/1/0/726
MAWRLQAKKKLGLYTGKESLENSPKIPSFSSKSAGEEKNTHVEEKFKQINKRTLEFSAQNLLSLSIEHGLTNSCVDDLLSLLQNTQFNSNFLPNTSTELRAASLQKSVSEPFGSGLRPVCALFTHSLERNGANNFCLFLVQNLLRSQPFIIIAPKNGPMQKDFSALNLPVIVINFNREQNPAVSHELKETLKKHNVGLVIANTIMRSDVIVEAKQMDIPAIWMIHESWPKDKLEYYAQEVFLRKDLTFKKIATAFEQAECVVFPSTMQKKLYQGLYRPEAAKTIYNGIPLERLDRYRLSMNRENIRQSLGYGKDDFLVLHIGTICGRKGQIFTAKACSKLINSGKCPNLKCLFVGARYIRDHEIAYIDSIKDVISSNDLTYCRFEDTKKQDLNKAPFTFMDIQSDVLKFYLAADIVVVASLNEVLPLVICEAMAFKKPVICSNIDAIPEAVTDQINGFLTPPGDANAISSAVLKLYGSKSLRERIGEHGRKRVESQFSYATMCGHWREIMDTSLAKALTNANMKDLGGRTILIDMDNTLVDWDGGFIRRYAKKTGKPIEEVRDIVRERSEFEIEKNFAEKETEAVIEVIQEQGFYYELKPFEGAVEALKEMVDMGVDVRLVTSPHPTCAAECAKEKYDWLEKYLGPSWIDRLVIARDKTYMYGDVLIDDKPKVSGKSKVIQWTQVVFHQNYNAGVSGKARLSKWSEWKEVVSQALDVVRPRSIKFQ